MVNNSNNYVWEHSMTFLKKSFYNEYKVIVLFQGTTPPIYPDTYKTLLLSKMTTEGAVVAGFYDVFFVEQQLYMTYILLWNLWNL